MSNNRKHWPLILYIEDNPLTNLHPLQKSKSMADEMVSPSALQRVDLFWLMLCPEHCLIDALLHLLSALLLICFFKVPKLLFWRAAKYPGWLMWLFIAEHIICVGLKDNNWLFFPLRCWTSSLRLLLLFFVCRSPGGPSGKLPAPVRGEELQAWFSRLPSFSVWASEPQPNGLQTSLASFLQSPLTHRPDTTDYIFTLHPTITGTTRIKHFDLKFGMCDPLFCYKPEP